MSCRKCLEAFALVAVAAALVACGGGGGDAAIAPPATPPAAPPGAPAAPPATAPAVALQVQAIKDFRFTWTDVDGETEYRLLEDADGASGYTRVATIPAGTTAHDHVVFLPGRLNARYILQACNGDACTDSAPVQVTGNLAAAAGYVKASNTRAGDGFGGGIALSADGRTLAVGAPGEDSAATGVNGNQADGSASGSGAVYVFVRSGATWFQQAYVKASNAGTDDGFGQSVALAADGNTLAVGAPGERSSAVGVDGNQADDSAFASGAAYVFTRSGSAWSQQAYLKASNSGTEDRFGESVALAADGNTLAVGAPLEDSSATGIDGDAADDTLTNAGAVYVFARAGGAWAQQAYVKASNTGLVDMFGTSVAIAADGSTLAVGAPQEYSSATGVDGNQADNSANFSGAVYVFIRSGGAWAQQAYVKASNTGAGDFFGQALALAADGNTLAVTAFREDSNGIGGQADDAATSSGAAYVFSRNGSAWSQQAYVKAPIVRGGDAFGTSVALSGDGSALAIGLYDPSGSTGIGGSQLDSSAAAAGAVHLFGRDGTAWTHRAYVKAPTTGADDRFGSSVALSADGATLAVGAVNEDSNAGGIGGDQANGAAVNSGAVVLY